MMRSHDNHTATIHLSLAMLSVIALSSEAAADDAKAGDTAKVAATDPDPAEPGSAASTTAATTDDAAPAPRYPRAVVARPLTLPKGLAMLGADAGANHDFSTMTGAPILGYGFTDDFEVQVPYAFATKDFEIKGNLAIDVGYKLLRGAAGGKLEAIARVRGGYSFLDEIATPLQLGVHVQYNFTDTLAVISGVPGSQQLRITLDDGGSMVKPIDFSLPIGVGYQATPELYLQLDTKLFQLDLSDSENLAIFADVTPVALTAVYNVMPALDVQAAIAIDLSNDEPGDTLSFLLGFRYYAGEL
jgi:hypothetical protein